MWDIFGYTSVTTEIRGAAHLRQGSHDRSIKAIDQARSTVGDQPNFTGLARLEAHRRSCRDVQAVSKSGLSIKGERRIRLGEMAVTANLDRSVTRVGDSKRNDRPILVQDNVTGRRKKFTRYHVRRQPERRHSTR